MTFGGLSFIVVHSIGVTLKGLAVEETKNGVYEDKINKNPLRY
ncbi:hypothetical protein [Niallia sp. Krafla_26]